MNEHDLNMKKRFKYNMSFYYQSTIIYFVVFILYVMIRGEFVENSFMLIINDPIIYFFAIIVSSSLIGLLYNLYINKYLEISDNTVSFVSRNKRKSFELNMISSIKISKEKGKHKNKAFRLVRIKIRDRKRRIIVRIYDYENQQELIEIFQLLKQKLEGK